MSLTDGISGSSRLVVAVFSAIRSGQSNMEMPVKGFRGQPVFGSQPYIVSANPKRPLRLYTVKNAWSTIPQEAGVDGEWKEASPEDVADFSATASIPLLMYERHW